MSQSGKSRMNSVKIYFGVWNTIWNSSGSKIYFMQYLFCVLLLCACNGNHSSNCLPEKSSNSIQQTQLVNPVGIKVSERFPVPELYTRQDTNKLGFASYLRNLGLKKHGSNVTLYNGQLKRNQSAHLAVVDMEIGQRDLQQCADAVIRLRGEYLFHQKRFNEISFTFTNGFKASFDTWSRGYQIQVKGNVVSWVKSSKNDASYASFRAYCEQVFTYAGSLSLSKQLNFVTNLNEIKSGDVFIRGGSPGHAVIVIDVAVNRVNGKKIFMLAQSYMPAQEIQILKNPQSTTESPWYEVEEIQTQLVTPEYIFNKDELMRF